MEIGKQLALFLDNRPGTLARVCALLAKEKINIHALTTSDTVDHIVVRMVLSDPQRALHLFEEHGSLVVSTDVLLLDGANKPGTLAEIAAKLGEAKINIDYAYCATSPTAHKGLLVLRTSDPKRALKVLNSQ
ncbi:MAG TPA: ACT domain-containing protein [Methylomirabilota bacterium]|nr:ACT domain-containing protein [Methylomirabilota bacterium]